MKLVQRTGDRKYKEIRRELNRRFEEKKKNLTSIVQEHYVDSSRMISVQLGSGSSDLKTIITQSGLQSRSLTEFGPGEPNDHTFVKLAEYHIKKNNLSSAIHCVRHAILINANSTAAKTILARCHMLLGNWHLAFEAAEIVLEEDRNNVKAILAKAEALFNMCHFEHALALFHRGWNLSPEADCFRLGVQKCRKTIEDGVGNPVIFHVDGVDVLFRLLRFTGDKKDSDLDADQATSTPRRIKMTMANLTSIVCKAPPILAEQEVAVNNKEALNSMSDQNCSKTIRKISKAKPAKSGPAAMDRLAEDKMYLAALSQGIGSRLDVKSDTINDVVKQQASQVLGFLKTREEFWGQMEMGMEIRQSQPPVSGRRQAWQSYRWLM